MRTTRGAVALLAGLAACLGAVAYAAAPREGAGPAARAGRGSPGGGAPLARPAIGKHPDKLATSTSARFEFSARGREPSFQCQVDRRAWSACRSPLVLTRLAAGSHSFAVRSVARRGRRSKSARFRWRVLEPKGFSIVPQLSGLGALYPGAPAQALPVTIANPNPVPIFVTSLSVSAAASPQGCSSAENLALIASSASSSQPIRVPANGSVSLPAPGASPPAIQLRDLPVNQDACQRIQFPLAFKGTARG